MACSEKDPPLVDTLGAGWRRTGGEREWRWGGHNVDRGGAADDCVHGRAGRGGHVRGTHGEHGTASRVLDIAGGGGTGRAIVHVGGRVKALVWFW